MVFWLPFCIALLYFPVWSLDYFFHDDLLFWLKNSPWASFGLYNDVSSHGRFLAAPLISIVGWGVNHIADLKALRFLNAVGLSVFSILLYRQLLKVLPYRIQSFLSALICLTLPSFALIATRASDVLIPWVWVASFYAGTIRGWKAAILFLICLLVYPPAAMMFWPAVFLTSVWGRDNGLRMKTIVGFLAIVTYGVVTLILSSKYSTESRHGMYNPALISWDVASKLKWFVLEPLANVLRGWQVIPVGQWPWLGSSFLLLCWFGFARSVGWVRAGMAIAFIFLSFLPNLIAKGDAAFYRCLGPLTVVVFLICVAGGMHWATQVRYFKKDYLTTSLLSIVFIFGAVSISRSVVELRVLPSVKEATYVTGVITAQDTGRYDHLAIRRRTLPFDRIRYDEWGALTTDYYHNTLMLMKATKTFPFATSHNERGIADYFIAEASVDPDSKRLILTGTRYKDFLKANVGTPQMRHWRLGEHVYLLFRFAPKIIIGTQVFLNMGEI